MYEGRGGLCSVRLSLPLLKLRPRKDLVETLLVNAFFFLCCFFSFLVISLLLIPCMFSVCHSVSVCLSVYLSPSLPVPLFPNLYQSLPYLPDYHSSKILRNIISYYETLIQKEKAIIPLRKKKENKQKIF